LDLAFFGLTTNNISEARFNVFKQIHEIVFHGNGGYSWETVYNMPVWLRNFTFSEIQKFHDNERERVSKVNKPNTTTVMDSQGNVLVDKNSIPKPIAPQKAPSYK
jgi:hypothetical protein